jgi:hypothetical protein
MMPDHCKHVSVHHVDYELSHDIIKKELVDQKIYKGTNSLILHNQQNNTWAIVEISKTPKSGLFWLITDIKLVATPEDTVFLVVPDVDVLNRNMMAKVSQAHPGKVVIVKGAFEHVSFMTPEPARDLLILEVIPPQPPKLTTLVDNLIKIESFSMPFNITEKIIDIGTLLGECLSKTIMLPCNASGLKTDKKILYLDEAPEIAPEEKDDITLAGCELSMKIFKSIYKFKPNFINICPVNLAEELTDKNIVLVKCCKTKSFERQGNLFMVPWGATYDDIRNCLKRIVDDFR